MGAGAGCGPALWGAAVSPGSPRRPESPVGTSARAVPERTRLILVGAGGEGIGRGGSHGRTPLHHSRPPRRAGLQAGCNSTMFVGQNPTAYTAVQSRCAPRDGPPSRAEPGELCPGLGLVPAASRAARLVPAIVPMAQSASCPAAVGAGLSPGVSRDSEQHPHPPICAPQAGPGAAECCLSYRGGAGHGTGVSSSGRGPGCRCPGCRAARCARSRG